MSSYTLQKFHWGQPPALRTTPDVSMEVVSFEESCGLTGARGGARPAASSIRQRDSLPGGLRELCVCR